MSRPLPDGFDDLVWDGKPSLAWQQATESGCSADTIDDRMRQLFLRAYHGNDFLVAWGLVLYSRWCMNNTPANAQFGVDEAFATTFSTIASVKVYYLRNAIIDPHAECLANIGSMLSLKTLEELWYKSNKPLRGEFPRYTSAKKT